MEGDFFVDSTCIDCDTCRWVARDMFNQAGDMSAVTRQPQTDAERLAAGRALLSCPTASIGYRGDKALLRQAADSLPISIDRNVFYLGYASESSFGAASYFIKRDAGNVMIDSPRMNKTLADQIQAMGGINHLFLTHRDDVADHAEWAQRFGSQRIMLKADSGMSTQDVELQLEGDEPYVVADDLLIIPQPGHTKGHAVLLYDKTFLFTGDHLEFDEDAKKLRAFRDFCWYSWEAQTASMKRLLAYDFEWVLPGHGRQHHADKASIRTLLAECVDWMESGV